MEKSGRQNYGSETEEAIESQIEVNEVQRVVVIDGITRKW